MRLNVLLALLPLIECYQLRTTLRTPASFSQPSTPALYLESLYHVSPEAYCSLLSSLAITPIPTTLSPSTNVDIIQYLLKRSSLTDHEVGMLKLSLSLQEFAPAASFNGSSNAHNCSNSAQYNTVYTDFSSPFEYSEEVIVRYRKPLLEAEAQRHTLSGYGAHLALKRTDYLVIDDSLPMKPKAASESKKVEALKVNQLANIGLRAAARIVRSEDPLAALEDISQNFPIRTTKVLASKIPAGLKDEVREIVKIVRGDIFMINGIEVDPTPDKLLPLLRTESELSRQLQSLGYNNSHVVNILTFDLELSPKVDKFDVRHSSVVYFNDFEKDEIYKEWPKNVDTFMRPLYPGQFHSIARNAHTVVRSVDLLDAEDREILSNFAMFVSRGLPVRWGIVPLDDTPLRRALAKCWREVVAKRGPTKGVEFLAAAVESDDIETVYKTWQNRKEASLSDYADLSTESISEDWIARFGASSMYANGRPVPKDENMMQRVSSHLRDDTMMMQEALLEGGIIDTGDLQDFFLGPNPLPVYSEALFGTRQHLTMRELLAQRNEACDKDFDIVLSGNWPSGFMEASDPCIRRVHGAKQLTINGRILKDLSMNEIPTLLAQEQEDLEKYRAAATRAGAPMSANILSLIRTTTAQRTILPSLKSSELSHFHLGDESTCAVKIDVYLDPLSENAQRWSTVLRTLSAIPDVFISVQLIPKLNIKEMPLKRFYRYLMQPELLAGPQGIEFSDIPDDLLVFSLDIWNNWVTSPLVATVDLDNLHLSTDAIDVDFEVSHILVEGHAKEVGNSSPPRGAQLTLSNESGQNVETIIMANLGYFQFKTQPGIWTLGIKHGRSSEIYELDDRQIEVSSWAGTTIYPRLKRKPGQETAEVLDDKLVAESGGLWSKLKGFTSTDVQANGKVHAEINIFTVASGHLYERFVYIMIASVMEHTKHSVKFWFISNFLSPQFQQFIPHLATHLNFEYEMITFSWPHWLRQQTEKQRIIWGYKILFLDVMFPLDLEKVIFVDADQVVRTDMIELINEDLKGKVWGYTPMCDSRKEIEGFRFWKQGYWKDFLRGKPYHISALYVIDLVAFRAQATGDRLRQQYHQLSADPASLSNLDQDLPNHLQAQIPIHSLSQEWLWCETWCSDESLKDAKTIDLCQNPMTKEPKLDRARRQLPEWTVYDQRIKDFAKTVAAQEAGENIGSIVVDVDSVGQNLEMKRDQLGDPEMHGEGGEESKTSDEASKDTSHDEL